MMSLRTFSFGTAVVFALLGCGDSVNNAPPAAAMAPRPASAPAKIPTTVEEKIAAIQKTSLPEEEKQKAIQEVRSGKL